MKTIFFLGTVIVVLAVLTPLAHAVDGHPAWNKKISGPGRFTVLTEFNREAVFDKETGLVWEKSPSTDTYDWFDAQHYCNALTVGNRMGWRLPTLQELVSLVDPSVPDPGPTLPSGHPFSNVQSSGYWSATNFASSTSGAWGMVFDDSGVVVGAKSSHGFVWCVRGGQGVDSQ
jgi:hypothetical protein